MATGYSPASTSASASASTSTLGLGAPLPPPSSTSHPVKRRRYARRSCLTCRSKKTRCELPDEAVASSHDPLPVYKACHRCRALDIPCVVWDGDRKRKPRVESATPSSAPPTSHNATPVHHPSLYSREHYTNHRSPRENNSYLDEPAAQRSSYRDHHPYPADASYASRDRYATSNDHRPNSASSFRRADLYERSRYPPESAASDLDTSFTSSKVAAMPPASSDSNTNHTAATTASNYDEALIFKAGSDAPDDKRKLLGQDIPILTNRNKHSPLVTLNRFITKIPSFSRLLRPEMDRSFDGQLSSLLTDENIHELQSHLPRLRLWHPHVSDLASLRAAYNERPKPSTSLLLASICLVASKVAGKRHLAKHFAIHVDRIGLQVLISAPKELHAAQAFELLLSHEPSLIGASVDPSGSSSTDSSVFGESLHSSAISIAESIGLDLVLSDASHDTDNGESNTPESDERLRWQLRRFSLWCSLSIWRAKFVFLNTVIRPHDFTRLRQDANRAIRLVETLRPRSRAEALNDIMFKAGVLALAHRALQVADFHSRLAQLETLGHSRTLFPDAEVRHEVGCRMEQHIEFLDDLKRTKRRRLWCLADLPELRFMDRWIDLEFHSDWDFIFQLYMIVAMPSKDAFTAADLSRSIVGNADLFRFLHEAAVRSYLRSEDALAGLAGTQRFEGESLEQTGLPLLLTCGYVLHVCICIMEGVSFVQYGLQKVSMRESMFALLFPQVAERLCGRAPYEAESLQKLVSGMLIQMSRRLHESEYARITKKTRPTGDASASAASSNDTALVSQQRSNSGAGQVSQHPTSVHHHTDHNKHRNSDATSYSHTTPVSDSSAPTNPNTPSLNWHETPNTSLSESSRLEASNGSNVHTMGTDGSQSAMAATTATTAASVLPASTAALMCSSDPLSSENMARIMDQILLWDCLPPAMDSSMSSFGNGM